MDVSQPGGRKMDRRTRYTRQAIRETLLELMEEKPFSRVTVTEVCRKAEMNRGTFYLHYLDLEDVLDDLDDKFEDRLDQIKAEYKRIYRS